MRYILYLLQIITLHFTGGETKFSKHQEASKDYDQSLQKKYL